MDVSRGRGSRGPTRTAAPDLDEARQALALLVEPGSTTELFSLHPPRYVHRPADRLDVLLADVAGHPGSIGNFVSINPLPPDFTIAPGQTGAWVRNFTRRRWFLLDVDPVKPARDVNATDAEHAAAREVMGHAAGFLAGKGWPDPLVLDTGGGWMALYRVDLPNEDVTRALFKRLLVALAGAFDTEGAKVDVDTAKATIHCRIPGTWNRKGPHEADRPHHMVRLARVPAALEVVSVERIQEVAGAAPAASSAPEPARPKRSPFRMNTPPSGRELAYVTKALNDECEAVAAMTEGRNNRLNEAAMKLGHYVGAGLLARELVEQRLEEAACVCGLDTDTGGIRGVRATIKSGLDAGEKEPHGVPEANGIPLSPERPSSRFEPGEKIFLRASEVIPEEVDFLWPGRIPLGMLTTFAGVTSLGKTFVLCDIAARVSRGLDWPDSGGECCKSGQVLFISGEDSLKHTIVPRLIEANAELDRVVFLTTKVQERFTLADLDILEEVLLQAGGGFRLVAIDPPTAFLPDTVDDNKNAQLRGLLSPLKTWAEKYHLALIFITHFNKRSGEGVDALARVMGSVAWVNAVRAAYMFAKDKEDAEGHRRLFLPLKINICAPPGGMAYRITKKGLLASVEWMGSVETTADEASHTPKKKTRGETACAWLVERFREKREWDSDALFEAARQDGISRDAIFEAKQRLELPKARRHVAPDGSVIWRWWVPEDWPCLGTEFEVD